MRSLWWTIHRGYLGKSIDACQRRQFLEPGLLVELIGERDADA
jgi:hypothetical protein